MAENDQVKKSRTFHNSILDGLAICTVNWLNYYKINANLDSDKIDEMERKIDSLCAEWQKLRKKRR